MNPFSMLFPDKKPNEYKDAGDGEHTICKVQCYCCKQDKFVVVETKGLKRWLEGLDHIQHALPMSLPAERELLLSQTCEECFDRMFKNDDDE